MPRRWETSPRHAGISGYQGNYYCWKRALTEKGEAGLINSKHYHKNQRLRTPPEIEEELLCLRKTYHLGPIRISWYLERYHGMKISASGLYHFLKRHGFSRSPQNAKRRQVLTKRYQKQVPGHHIQVKREGRTI